jgi:DNA uptake protein ComE-like DNA-binding protein
MQSVGAQLQQILDLAPEWRHAASRLEQSGIKYGALVHDLGQSTVRMFELLEEVGGHAVYAKLASSGKEQEGLLKLVRDSYLLPLSYKMLRSNGTIRRFYAEKHVGPADLKAHLMSMSADVAWKLEAALVKSLEGADPKGNKFLIPAYVQTCVNNAVLDHIKSECQWERQTSSTKPDEDGNEEDSIERAPDDLERVPDQIILSKEKVHYLNQLRAHLKKLFEQDKDHSDMSLTVIDLAFGLGLTPHSRLGVEKTMRECCEILQIPGETQARKIARCQVFLDKGMDRIRLLLREDLPGVVQCWQTEVNVNVASRRDLDHKLDFTEGEIDRLVVSRQYLVLDQLVERAVVKSDRLPALRKRGAVAAFVPVDLNSATPRDLADILGLSRELCGKIVAARPIGCLEELVQRRLLSEKDVAALKQRGAVARSGLKKNLNMAKLAELVCHGVSEKQAAFVLKGCPFRSWTDLDQYLVYDERTWALLKENFHLGENPA